MTKDYYEILGISKDASIDEIKKAYRKSAQKYHPDRGGDEKKFKEINEAYQILSDPQKRSQYDQFGSAGFEQQSGYTGGFEGFQDFDFSDIFSSGENSAGGFGDLFDMFFSGGKSRKSGPTKGSDLEMSLILDFNEAVFGTKKEVEIERIDKCKNCNGNGAEPGTKIKDCLTCHGKGEVQRTTRTPFSQFAQITTCPDCQGEGKIPEKPCSVCNGKGKIKIKNKINVDIPAGVDKGSIIRVPGQGYIGDKGGSYGDLFINIDVSSHEFFERKGNDIYFTLPINFAQATLGDKVEVPTIDGKVLFKIPQGVQSESLFKLKGKGISFLNKSGRGDQIIIIKVITPTSLTSKEKELINELNQEMKKPHEEGFWEKIKKGFNL